MDIMEVSLLHHAGIVLLFLWLLSTFNCCHPIAYIICLVYLYLVHERFIMRLRRKLQHEERRQGNQRRVLTDSETVRWLNHAVEKIWPICMEQIASQKIFLPIIPWFLDKYKPWTAKKALVQHLYLGRNPPMFTEMRVLNESSEDDHLVLELGMNFLTADDMSAILAVKLRKRLGFGMWARLHLTGMHVEGKVLVGVKFIQNWPFISRLRLCFAEPPYFQMTVKPLFTHGLDVTVLPGIAGWLDKLLSVAFEQTLVEPNMLVVDMEKFVSPKPAESWFSVDVKEPVAYAKLEVIEASDMKPSDLNGLADPYVKGQLGLYRFKTKIQKKTLFPKWHQEFKIPIVSWESENVLLIEVRDKDHFIDDLLGVCSININDKRDGQRHDMWLPLQNVNTGRLHLVVTIFEENVKVDDQCNHGEEVDGNESRKNSFKSETADKGASLSSVSSRKSQIVADNFEPIDVEGQKETGIWVHHPGSEIAKTWEPRKGKSRRLDTKVEGKANPSITITNVDDDSSGDENAEEKQRRRSFRRGIRRLSAIFHRSPRKDEQFGTLLEPVRSPSMNVRAVNAKRRGGVKLVLEEKVVVEEKLIVSSLDEVAKDGKSSSERSDQENGTKGNAKGKSRNIFHPFFSRKGLDDSPGKKEKEVSSDSDSSEDDENMLLPPLPHHGPTAREISNVAGSSASGKEQGIEPDPRLTGDDGKEHHGKDVEKR